MNRTQGSQTKHMDPEPSMCAPKRASNPNLKAHESQNGQAYISTLMSRARSGPKVPLALFDFNPTFKVPGN